LGGWLGVEGEFFYDSRGYKNANVPRHTPSNKAVRPHESAVGTTIL